jgi:hypothetical protein
VSTKITVGNNQNLFRGHVTEDDLESSVLFTRHMQSGHG